MTNTILNELPLSIELGDTDVFSFILFFQEHKEAVHHKLSKYGALKFKGVRIGSLEDFQEIVNSISDEFLSYVDGNSPRTKLSKNVYTSTEYDKSQKITMHNELSYSEKWPKKLFFSCLRPAETGGETLLADSREILKEMDDEIVAEIEKKGITYLRNLHGGSGMGPSWQDTFETADKNALEGYLKSRNIDFVWSENNVLTIKQHRKGTIMASPNGQKVWFNQIDQFHPFHLGKEIFNAMQLIYSEPENFPMYVTYGDGTEISSETVQAIMDTIDKLTFAPRWKKNELLIIDNELVCHGRNSFDGERKVLVSMSK